MMKRILLFIFLIGYAILLNSCSTFINSTTQEIEIKSNPVNAKIIVDGKKYGTTPQKLNLDRGSNHVVKLDLDGYEVYETQLTKKISFWFWGNALNGFIPGMLIDMITGSMYNLLPDKIDVELTTLPAKLDKGTKK